MESLNGAHPTGAGAPASNGGPPAGVDLAAAERAVRMLMRALAIDGSSPGLRDTPARAARAFAELTTPRPFRATTFPNDGDADALVVVRDITFHSLCEHHLLPFFGRAHVGYVPGERILGLSKLPRLVEACARRPQVQERLTAEIAHWLEWQLEPRGVGVVVEATHLCMAARGVGQAATTLTQVVRGAMCDPAMRAELRPGAG